MPARHVTWMHPSNQGASAMSQLSFRLRAGAIARTLGLLRYWPTRWLGSARLCLPERSASPHRGLLVQLRQGRSYLRTDGSTTGRTELALTPTVIPHDGAIRRYCLERNGLACGGSNRQPGRPHDGYLAKPPKLQRIDERRVWPAHWSGFGSLPGLWQRVTTAQASLDFLVTFLSRNREAA